MSLGSKPLTPEAIEHGNRRAKSAQHALIRAIHDELQKELLGSIGAIGDGLEIAIEVVKKFGEKVG